MNWNAFITGIIIGILALIVLHAKGVLPPL